MSATYLCEICEGCGCDVSCEGTCGGLAPDELVVVTMPNGEIFNICVDCSPFRHKTSEEAVDDKI